MTDKIHISVLRKMLKSRNTPVNIKLWTKKGEIQEWRNCIPLRYNFYAGTRQMKMLDSREIRTVRDVCIFSINDLEIFL